MEKEFKDINDAREENGMFYMDNVEIFQTGKWNGDVYTTEDLDEMETSYMEIGAQIKPFLKLGHNKEQKLLKSAGMPAAGWIQNVRREGESLMADFVNIPKKIYTLIKNKQYGRMSSEIYWNLKTNEKTYKRVLKAVALLGAETPAVKTLDDFINLYTENEIEYQEIKDYHNIIKEHKMEEIKIYQDQINDLKTQLKDYAEVKDENAKLKSDNEKFQNEVKEFSGKVEALEAEKEKIYMDAKAEEVKGFLSKAVEDGKILPAQVEMYTELSIDKFDMVKGIVEASGKQVDFTEKTEHNEDDKGKDKEEKLYDLAIEYAKVNKCDFKEARIAVEMEVE